MRTTIALDDDLIAEAKTLSGLTENAAVVREALRALIARETARRLASLGGYDPTAEGVPRRRQESGSDKH
jgi:Arc/MetJ family transcription regulator